MKFLAALQAQPKHWLIAEAWLLTFVIGFVDFWSGWEVSLFLFYAVPILLVTWCVGQRAGIMSAFGGGLVWFLANFMDNSYATTSAYAWASTTRMIYLLFVAIGGFALKRQQEEMRGRLDALMRTRELEQEIVRISEREQMRIGQDLHDGLCQSLAAIGFSAGSLKADLEAKSLPEKELAATIQKEIKEAVIEARSLARGIFPVQMDVEGLPTAMEELVAQARRHADAQILLDVHGEARLRDPQVGMHLYRIAQEAISNALRHADASEVRITLDCEPERLVLEVSDDGKGLRKAGPRSRGMGMRTMNYRARLVGAELEVKARAPRGTTVRCVLPVGDEVGARGTGERHHADGDSHSALG